MSWVLVTAFCVIVRAPKSPLPGSVYRHEACISSRTRPKGMGLATYQSSPFPTRAFQPTFINQASFHIPKRHHSQRSLNELRLIFLDQKEVYILSPADHAIPDRTRLPTQPPYPYSPLIDCCFCHHILLLVRVSYASSSTNLSPASTL